MSLSLAVVEGS